MKNSATADILGPPFFFLFFPPNSSFWVDRARFHPSFLYVSLLLRNKGFSPSLCRPALLTSCCGFHRRGLCCCKFFLWFFPALFLASETLRPFSRLCGAAPSYPFPSSSQRLIGQTFDLPSLLLSRSGMVLVYDEQCGDKSLKCGPLRCAFTPFPFSCVASALTFQRFLFFRRGRSSAPTLFV